MGYRNLFVENAARLSVKNGQLVVCGEDEENDSKEVIIPVEDLDAVLIENTRSTITIAAISLLGSNKVAVYICDEKHIPSAVLLPYSQHSRQLRVEKLQLSCKKPLRKQIWKDIVKRKIKNQSIVLSAVGEEETSIIIDRLSEKVSSGDKDNIEAAVARKYFSALFGTEFARREEDNINSALNYGYAILRGAIARSIASHGLIASIGVHHKSELNAFNLADDLIEPFRPIVDLYVFNHFDESESELSVERKAELLNLLNVDVVVDGKLHSITNAIELEVDSLVRSFEREQAMVILPKITQPNPHRYG